MGYASCINTALILTFKASIFITNCLLGSGSAKSSGLIMTFLRVLKALTTFSFQTKAFSSVVKLMVH
jgi:hypothetical protein